MHIFLNGQFVKASRARVSVYDHGFLYGDGVYETIRVYNGRPSLLDDHLERFLQSAAAIRLRVPLSKAKLRGAIARLIKRNRLKEGVLRITLTRGPGPHGFDPRVCPNPTLVMALSPFQGYPPPLFRRGIAAAIVRVRRNHPLCLPPTVKSTSCLNGILAKMESIDMRAQEGILLSLDGRVAEGTVSNVFMVKNGVIFTPTLGENFLHGVMREFVCKLARRLGFRVVEKDLKPAELRTADEIFLTSTLMNIMPVTRLVWADGKRMKSMAVGARHEGRGRVGRVTQALSFTLDKTIRF